MTMRFVIAATLALTTAAAPAAAQDATAGGAIFKQRCQMCHSVTPGAAPGGAPNLAGVVGRKAAGTAFNYSTALRQFGRPWTKPTLDLFLAAPMKLVPGTRMVISIPDPKQRADVIAYLATIR